MRFGMFCVTAYEYMSQNLVSMWLSAKNNYCRRVLLKDFTTVPVHIVKVYALL
jgi:hypothetical protein